MCYVIDYIPADLVKVGTDAKRRGYPLSKYMRSTFRSVIYGRSRPQHRKDVRAETALICGIVVITY